ncbi:MAG: hypothetical protein RLZZ546_2208 [Bacteroidota bacterium]|jgi:hypothetical protein
MKRKYCAFIFIFTLLSACKNQQGSHFESIVKSQLPHSDAMETSSYENYQDQKKINSHEKGQETNIKKDVAKIIKDGTISIEVSSLETSKKYVDKIVKKHKAYYESDVYSSSSYKSEYKLKIRMSPEFFEMFNDDLKNIDGKVVEKDIKSRDVTKEYLDIEIRINNASALMKKYQDMLLRANKISEMIEIQNKINEIEIQIESYKGEIKYLIDRINYSSLDISIIQKHEYVSMAVSEKFTTKLFNAIKTGWQIILSLILGIFTIWPIVILSGLGLFYYKKIKKKRIA